MSRCFAINLKRLDLVVIGRVPLPLICESGAALSCQRSKTVPPSPARDNGRSLTATTWNFKCIVSIFCSLLLRHS